MTDASNATCTNTEAYAIGSSFNATEDIMTQPPVDCFPYTAADKNSIVAETISRNDTNGTVQTGVSLTYSGGGACISTGAPTTFTIKAWCDPTLPIEQTNYTGLVTNNDPCHPTVEITSQIGGCDLLSNSPIW